MADIWTRLRGQGLKLAVCSNLASPYGVLIRHTLPNYPDMEVLSYKVGAIKLEPAIYVRVIEGLKAAPDKVLFVGDTVKADIEGPRAAGMKALHVEELVRIMGKRRT